MSGTGIARLPEPPYFAVIFASKRASVDADAYAAVAEAMVERGRAQPGFLGIESARGNDGVGITISYWRDEASILAWKRDAAHGVAQQQGKERWYEHYEIRIARVERAYGKV
jgi:heme-degrading monooxygenase HmoA